MTEETTAKEQELAELVSEFATEMQSEHQQTAMTTGQEEQEERKQGLTIRQKPKRLSTVYTRNKIPCWMSIDIHLVDIILQQEVFVINAWLVVFFKDVDNDFTDLFDDNALQHMQHHKYMNYDDLSVSVRKKLPLKNSFLLNATDMDMQKSALELHNKEQNIWKLYFRFNAACAEHMELSTFPFDAQFLNLQIIYRIQDFYFLSECPQWILNDENHTLFATHKPIKLTVKDSIKSQWSIEQPWIDLRSDRGTEYNFHFSVIRLRVRREPVFYLLNGILPLFLVIACSFASFVMPIDEYLGDKLAYIITLLLTTAAFQYALSTDLPKTSETTMVDAYILYGYFILSFFTLEIAIVYKINSLGYETAASIVDYITVAIFAIIWILKSTQFVYQYWNVKNNDVDWQKISHDEMKGWSKDMQGNSKYIGVANGEYKGTNDQ